MLQNSHIQTSQRVHVRNLHTLFHSFTRTFVRSIINVINVHTLTRSYTHVRTGD